MLLTLSGDDDDNDNDDDDDYYYYYYYFKFSKMLFVLETTMFSTFSLVLSQDLRLQGPFSIWWPFQEVQTFAKF